MQQRRREQRRAESAPAAADFALGHAQGGGGAAEHTQQTVMHQSVGGGASEHAQRTVMHQPVVPQQVPEALNQQVCQNHTQMVKKLGLVSRHFVKLNRVMLRC